MDVGYTRSLASISVLYLLLTWAPCCASTRPQLYSNSTLGSRGPLDLQRRQALVGAVPAATAGLGGLVLGGVLYGLTVLPAFVALLGAGGGLPLAGLFSSLFRHKRSSSGSKSDATAGFLDAEDTQRLLRLLRDALSRWGSAPESCRRRYVCQLAAHAHQAGLLPDISPMDDAVSLLFTGLSSAVSNGPSMELLRAARDGLRHRCHENYLCDAPLTAPGDRRRDTK